MQRFSGLILALWATSHICAQVVVTGLVRDLNSSEPLVGAHVFIENGSEATVTDIEGRFEITGVVNQTLRFEYLGYESQDVVLLGEGTLEVFLSVQETLLEEIVVTALGLERASKKLGYPVQQLAGNEINEVKSANMVQGLAGKIAGVQVNQGATGIGSSSKITIRGEASFTNNNPLFVVDGIPINNNTVFNVTNEAAAGFQAVDFGSGAMNINPDDIASISVLKGPSAAALYGTRASNGVILVTTKNGQESKGIGVSFNSSFSLEAPFKLPQFQNVYGQGNSGKFAFVDGLGGGINDNITYSWGPALNQGNVLPQFDSPVTLPGGEVIRGGDVAVHGGSEIPGTPFTAHPDNLSDFYRTGHTIQNNLAIAGASEHGHYRISLTDFRNESIIPGTNLNRNSLGARLNFSPTSKWEVNSTLYYIHSKSDNRPGGGYGSENVNYSLVAWGPRSLDTEILRDYWQPGLEGLQQYSFNYTFFDNPYFILHENRNAFSRDRLFGNFSTQYQISSALHVKVGTALDLSKEERTFRRQFSTNRFGNGAYAEHGVSYREQNTDLVLNYDQKFSGVGISALVGISRLDQWAESDQLQTLSLAQPGIFSLSNAAAPIKAFSFNGRKRINSFFGVAKFEFSDLLFLEISGRYDWSSTLATPHSTDQVSFFYPSVSASWILSNMWEIPSLISFAKLRASWAAVGNDTNPFQTSGVFLAQTPFESQPTFTAQNIIANEKLVPEQTRAIELGAEVRFFDDRLRFDVTYYNALTTNQIISLPVAQSSGYAQQVINGGEVRSKGVELVASIQPKFGPNFRWQSTFNFSLNRTQAERLPVDIEGRLTLAYSRIYDNVNQTTWVQVKEGERIGDLYGTGYLRNENGDFVIDDNGRYIVDNRLIRLGNYNPDFMIGWTNHFTYKNWDAYFLFDWRQGGVLVSRTQALAGVGGQLLETADRPEEGIIANGVVNVGTAESPVWQANDQAVTAEQYFRQYYDRNHEENNTYDASYVKLRELSLAYTFEGNDSFLGDDRSLKLSLVGRNLFAVSDIPHFDPEQLAVQGTGFVSGVEDMSYATSRSVGIKLSLQL